MPCKCIYSLSYSFIFSNLIKYMKYIKKYWQCLTNFNFKNRKRNKGYKKELDKRNEK